MVYAFRGLELGESTEDAARRELLEETGLTAGDLELLGVFSGEGMRYTYPNGDRVCIVQVIYICREYTGMLKPEDGELTELCWFDIESLPDNISPPDRKAFQAFIQYMYKKTGTE